MTVKSWARVALIGIPVYVVLDVVAQLLSTRFGIRQAESLLAISGPFGFLMNINFLVRGVLSIAVVIALSKHIGQIGASVGYKTGRVLFLIWAGAALLLAFFNCDDVSPAVTFHGKMHVLLGAAAFIAAPIGILLISISFRKVAQLKSIWVPALVISILDIVVFLALYMKKFVHVSGIVERIGIGLVLVWVGIVAWRLYRLGRLPSARA